MRKFLFIFFVVQVVRCASPSVFAQDDSTTFTTDSYPAFEEKELRANADSSLVEKKSFAGPDLQSLRADPDLNYKETPTMAESLWDRFWKWVGQLLGSLLENAVGTNVGRILLYTLGLIVLIGIVMALLKVNAFRVFYSGADQGNVSATVFHENIHEMDFERLIDEAVDKKKFRHATRLIFLYALKLLSDKHLVQWDPGKTNHDYVEELKLKELKTGFNELSFYFEYAWYGNFVINTEIFNRVQGIFNEWKDRL